jgi:molybdate transport system substrate-binding protein
MEVAEAFGFSFSNSREGHEMNRLANPLVKILAVVLFVSAVSPASAQVKVLMSGGFRAAYQDILPGFEKRTDISVTTSFGASQGDGPGTIGAQLRGGISADVVIMSKAGLTELVKEGRIAKGTEVDLAQTPLAVAVRAGSPKPNVSTVEAFRQTLLQAKSITFQSSTVIYLRDRLLPQLGITENVMAKHTETGPGAVADGTAQLAIAPVSEILHVPGVDYVGTIPAQIQLIQTFSAAVVSGSKEMEASKRLILFLTSDEAGTAIRKSGMEPVHAGSSAGEDSAIHR